MDTIELNSQLHKWLDNVTTLLVQYYVVGAIVLFTLFVWKRVSAEYAKIQLKYPDSKQIKRELFYSLITLLITGTSITFTVWLNKHGYTRAYKPIDKYGWGYYFLSFFLMLIVHDTYFYWTHRFMHWKRVFKFIHKIHHESTNPTPFTCYSMHPVEAAIGLAILYVIVFTIPHHSSMATIFFAYSFIVNITAHLGYEFMPKWFVRNKVLRWVNTSVHHNLHHSNVKGNYSYYFNFWDRVMKTNHTKYEEHFDKVVDRRNEGKAARKRVDEKLSLQQLIE